MNKMLILYVININFILKNMFLQFAYNLCYTFLNLCYFKIFILCEIN